jgi:hypothetical protein
MNGILCALPGMIALVVVVWSGIGLAREIWKTPSFLWWLAAFVVIAVICCLMLDLYRRRKSR